MQNTLHTMAIHTFVPMLDSLSEILDKAAAHATKNNLDLVNARLAPDMYPLVKQIELACHYAADTTARLAGKPARQVAELHARALEDLRSAIATCVREVGDIGEAAFAGAEDRDCSIPIPNGMVIEMNGLQFLRSWALPHFYFHVVTAYDILRHNGVNIGKQDYLSQVGRFIRPPRS
jgi:hypothetical protein